jgi:hypothetical protein
MKLVFDRARPREARPSLTGPAEPGMPSKQSAGRRAVWPARLGMALVLET